MRVELDRSQHTTVVTALIHYALAVADPDWCIEALETVSPDPPKPWREIITEARNQKQNLFDTTEKAGVWD